jgi:dipeptidyl aminopeptidase/acylaminoacyl peptidase
VGELDTDRWALAVFDPASGTPLARLTVGEGAVREPWFALAPDGRSVAVPGAGETIVAVREVATGGVRTTVRHAGPVTGAAFTPDGRRLAVASAEAPVYMWDYRGDRLPRPLPDVEAMWADLATRDAARAFRTVVALARRPDDAVPLLKGKLPPVTPADPVDVRATIAELDAADFRTRDRASARLRRLADRAVPLLREAKSAAKTPEARRRLDDLLTDRTLTHDQLRAIRAVEVLEGIGPAARPLLAAWAAGAEGARLTAEAAVALRRIGPG